MGGFTMKKIGFLLLAVFLSTLLIACTDEAEAGPYARVAIGSTDYDYNEPFVNAYFDDKAKAKSIAVGYTLPAMTWLSLEFEVADFGEADRSPHHNTTTQFEADAKTFWLVGDWNVATFLGKPFDLSARAGLSRGEATLSVNNYSMSSTDTGKAYGVGAKLWFSPSTAITLDRTTYDLEFGSGGITFNYNPTTTMLGVQHKF